MPVANDARDAGDAGCAAMVTGFLLFERKCVLGKANIEQKFTEKFRSQKMQFTQVPPTTRTENLGSPKLSVLLSWFAGVVFPNLSYIFVLKTASQERDAEDAGDAGWET